MNRYGIVIIGYKNTRGISRLLESLDKVDFQGEQDITLIVSIDYSGDDSVEKLANEFEWKYGEKYVVAHRKNLGLRTHIISCGDYMDKYNLSAIAVLEDDIYVSPEMYVYMSGAVDYYKDNPKVAGIALYKHEYNIYAKHPFDDYYDYGDTFFVQYAMSWGQIWLHDQWQAFRQWYNEERWKEIDKKRIPRNILQWKNSWLKYHIMYCIANDLYFVYPRVSLATNFSDVGEHNKVANTSMQVKLCMKKTMGWQFSDFERTNAVYDAFFENMRMAQHIGLDNFEMDLYGVKEYKDSTRYVLTRNHLPKKVIKSWGLFLRPMESNIYMDIPGEDIFLYDLTISDNTNTSKKSKDKFFEYELKGINILCIENIRFCISRIVNYIKQKVKRMMK